MKENRPHPVDIHVGRRLRSRRTMMGLSQEALGEAVDITFQQIQKYERGYNRIGSSRLYEFACILDINVGYFFDEYDVNAPTDTEYVSDSGDTENNSEAASSKEILTLIRSYHGIPDEGVRRKILSLMRSLTTYKDFNPNADTQNDTANNSSVNDEARIKVFSS